MPSPTTNTFCERRAVQIQYIQLRVPAHGNDSIRPAHKQGHRYPQEGPICQRVVLGKALEDQIVYSHDADGRAQPRQQMLGGMVDAAGREPALHKWRPQELTGKHTQPPGMLSHRQGTCGNGSERGGRLVTAVAIVEEAQVDCIAAVLPQGRGQAFGIAGQACALVNGGAGVEDYASGVLAVGGTLAGRH